MRRSSRTVTRHRCTQTMVPMVVRYEGGDASRTHRRGDPSAFSCAGRNSYSMPFTFRRCRAKHFVESLPQSSSPSPAPFPSSHPQATIYTYMQVPRMDYLNTFRVLFSGARRRAEWHDAPVLVPASGGAQSRLGIRRRTGLRRELPLIIALPRHCLDNMS
jgi:hypothetical protein